MIDKIKMVNEILIFCLTLEISVGSSLASPATTQSAPTTSTSQSAMSTTENVENYVRLFDRISTILRGISDDQSAHAALSGLEAYAEEYERTPGLHELPGGDNEKKVIDYAIQMMLANAEVQMETVRVEKLLEVSKTSKEISKQIGRLGIDTSGLEVTTQPTDNRKTRWRP